MKTTEALEINVRFDEEKVCNEKVGKSLERSNMEKSARQYETKE